MGRASSSSMNRRLWFLFVALTISVVIVVVWVDLSSETWFYRGYPDPGLVLLGARDDPLWRGEWTFADLGLINRIRVPLNTKELTYNKVRALYPMMHTGGFFTPLGCRPHNRTAIVIPYRDRQRNLMIFLRNIIPFLIRQMGEFRIFVVEQTSHHAFNKGTLINVGYQQAQKLYNFTCFIFHDVDLLPLDFRNFYRCQEPAMHLVQTLSRKHRLGPAYSRMMGGAVSFTRTAYEAINGFSNRFYGWGGEDDDMFRRFRKSKFPIRHVDSVIGSYWNLRHPKEAKNPERTMLLRKSGRVWKKEGLNSVKTRRITIKERKLFTHIMVEILPPSSIEYFE